MEYDKKSIRLGKVLEVTKDKKTRKTIKLGNEGSTDPKWNFTVDIRIKDHEGNVLAKVTNPWVTINDAHPKAPQNVLNDLVIWIDKE